jgi:hypothetical protein
MDRLRRVLDPRLTRARRVEPGVRRIVAGGLSLVSGLWLVDAGTRPLWLAGLGLVALGALALATGIHSQIDR